MDAMKGDESLRTVSERIASQPLPERFESTQVGRRVTKLALSLNFGSEASSAPNDTSGVLEWDRLNGSVNRLRDTFGQPFEQQGPSPLSSTRLRR